MVHKISRDLQTLWINDQLPETNFRKLIYKMDFFFVIDVFPAIVINLILVNQNKVAFHCFPLDTVKLGCMLRHNCDA